MKITVRKIGNSRGILIPAALLAACRIESEIELHVAEGRLVMTPVRAPRAGWFAKLVTEKETAGAGWPDVLPGDEKDWAW